MTSLQKLKILIIDDEQRDADDLIAELETGGLEIDATRVARDDELAAQLAQPWDAVLCDYVVPSMEWSRSLEMVRRADESIPFIVVSGKRGETYAVETMRGGANDYIVKTRLMRLLPSIQREVEEAAKKRRARDIQRRLEEELQRTRRLEATGRLAGGLAHNLNNLLTVIMGGLDIAGLNESIGEDAIYIDKAARAVETAAQMVRQLASLGQQPEYEPSPVGLADVVSRVDGLLRPVLPEGVSLDRSCPDDLPPITADGAQLEQALLNLLLNARDALEGRGRISLEADIENREEVVLRVRDDGVGIAEDLRERIFEPFYSTKGGEGTGLGLSSVDSIARSHLGGISVRSQLGEGSTFEIRFPFTEASEEQSTISHDWPRGENHLLVVDDAEDALLTTKAILERCGYRVSAVRGFADALRSLQSETVNPDLVLADAAMRGGGARDLLHWIQEEDKAIPVMLTSGFEAERDKRYRLYEGFAGFVQKPYRGADLASAVALALAEDKH